MTGDYGPGGNTVTVMEYNLATYLLINDGGDFVNGLNQTPRQWWGGSRLPGVGRRRASEGARRSAIAEMP